MANEFDLSGDFIFMEPENSHGQCGGQEGGNSAGGGGGMPEGNPQPGPPGPNGPGYIVPVNNEPNSSGRSEENTTYAKIKGIAYYTEEKVGEEF